MVAFVVIALIPGIQIGLRSLKFRVKILAERDLVKLLLHRPAVAFTDTFGLWAISLI